MSVAPLAWLDGAPPTPSLAFSRGLQYGDGVFRTILKYNGQLIDLELHIRKLNNHAERLDLDPLPAQVLREEAAGISAGIDRCVLKFLLMRAGTGRGYRPQGRASERLLLRYAAPAYPETHWSAGILAFRCSLALQPQPHLAGVKHLNRLEQVLASRHWPEPAAEGILCGAGGDAICGTRSNLFCVRDGTLHTPALDACGVAGLMRDKVLAAAAALAVPARIEPLPWTALLEADEAFVCNSLIGIWPLRALEQRSWQAPGPLTEKLMAALRHPRLT